MTAAWITDAVCQFGVHLGLDNFQPNARGGLQLTLQNGGLLAIEPTQRGTLAEVLVYASRPTGYQAPGLLKAGLAKSFDNQAGPYPVQVALYGSGADAMLLALIRVAERDFTLPILEKSVDFLRRWLDELVAI